MDGWGSTASRLEPLWGGSLFFTTKFPEIPGMYSFYQPWKDEVKGWVSTLKPPSGNTGPLVWESSILTTRPLGTPQASDT